MNHPDSPIRYLLLPCLCYPYPASHSPQVLSPPFFLSKPGLTSLDHLLLKVAFPLSLFPYHPIFPSPLSSLCLIRVYSPVSTIYLIIITSLSASCLCSSCDGPVRRVQLDDTSIYPLWVLRLKNNYHLFVLARWCCVVWWGWYDADDGLDST